MDQEYNEEFDEEEYAGESASQEELLESMNAFEEQQKQIEERILKNKLKVAMMRIAGGATALNMSEKTTVKKAKKFPNLKKNINRLNLLLAANKTKLAMKAMSASPVLFYVGIGVLILFLIICVVVIAGSTMSWLFPNEDGSSGEVSSAFGITGKDFYGARMVYKDDEQAVLNIIEDYVELVESGIEETKTLSIPNVTLEINITLPEEGYDYSQFEENEFKTTYSVLYSTVFDIAKAVYKVDNAADYTGVNLVECVNGVLYFGFGETAMADVSNIVANSIINNKTITSNGENPASETEVNSQISSKIATLCGQEKYKVRTEKLFVKDYILEKEDSRMSNISKENYVAFIFMPKKNVTFTKFSFAVGNANLSELAISLTNNGNEINLRKDDFDYGSSEDENLNSYMYVTNENLSVSASIFTDINVDNLSALSGGLSLFDVVENVDNFTTYLEEKTNESLVNYYTFKQNGVIVNLNNNEAFNFVEYETVWKSAS